MVMSVIIIKALMLMMKVISAFGNDENGVHVSDDIDVDSDDIDDVDGVNGDDVGEDDHGVNDGKGVVNIGAGEIMWS